jgi:hypothetical protein
VAAAALVAADGEPLALGDVEDAESEPAEQLTTRGAASAIAHAVRAKSRPPDGPLCAIRRLFGCGTYRETTSEVSVAAGATAVSTDMYVTFPEQRLRIH